MTTMTDLQDMTLEQLRDNLAMALRAKEETAKIAKGFEAEAVRRAQQKNDANALGTNRLDDALSVSAWETRDLDQEAAAALYAQAEASYTLNLLPITRDVKITYRLNMTDYKAAEKMNPAVFAAVDAIVGVKKKSPSVKVLEAKA